MEPRSADKAQEKHNGTKSENPAHPSRQFTLRSDLKIRRDAENESSVKREEQLTRNLEWRPKKDGSKGLARLRSTARAHPSGVEQGVHPTSSVSTQSGVVIGLSKAEPIDNAFIVKKLRRIIDLGKDSDQSLEQREDCRLRSSNSSSDQSTASRQAPLSHTVSSY